MLDLNRKFLCSGRRGSSGNSPVVDLKSAHSQSQPVYRVIPFIQYSEEGGLPPKLTVTFQIKCFQEFIKIFRDDEVDSNTGSVSIILGALVQEDMQSVCESAKEITVDAGVTYSGREYKVIAIQDELQIH